VPFTSFTVFWRNGGTRPARPVALPCIPSFLARHHASPPFLRTDPKVRKKHDFLQNELEMKKYFCSFFKKMLCSKVALWDINKADENSSICLVVVVLVALVFTYL